MIHAENTEGTIAGFATFGQWPWLCGHDIPRDRDRCDCGARRAVIAVDYRPVLEPADS